MKRLLCIVVVLLTISCRKASVSLLNRLESGCLSESVIGLVDSYMMAHPKEKAILLINGVDKRSFDYPDDWEDDYNGEFIAIGPVSAEIFMDYDAVKRYYPSSYFVYKNHIVFVSSSLDSSSCQEECKEVYLSYIDSTFPQVGYDYWLINCTISGTAKLLTKCAGKFLLGRRTTPHK